MADGTEVAALVNFGRQPRCKFPGCTREHTKLCDFPVSGKKSKTCDAKMCDQHAHNVGPDRDYCHEHAT